MSGVAFEEETVAVAAGGIAIAVIGSQKCCGFGLFDASDFAVARIDGEEDFKVGEQTFLHHVVMYDPSVFGDDERVCSVAFGQDPDGILQAFLLGFCFRHVLCLDFNRQDCAGVSIPEACSDDIECPDSFYAAPDAFFFQKPTYVLTQFHSCKYTTKIIYFCISKQRMVMEELNKELPGMAQDGIHAGFPSPATDYMTQAIDLNKEIVRHPAATFYGRVVGDSMIDAGVEEGDILVIDRSLEAQNGDMAVCFVDGEFTLKRLCFTDGGLKLVPANHNYPEIEITEGIKFIMWGVVTYVIKKVR